MLLGAIARFFLSILITHWIYSETVLVCPPFDPFAKQVLQVVQIPTHDKWGQIADDAGADRLSAEMDRAAALKAPGIHFELSHFFDDQVKSIWKLGSLKGLQDMLFASNSSASDRPFLSGDEIFSHHVQSVIGHATF
jgi:hypothetical protein